MIELARRARPPTSIHETALWLFLDGVRVPEDCLRAAYLHLLKSLDADVVNHTGSADPDDQADALATSAAQSRTGPSIRAQRAAAKAAYQTFKNTEESFKSAEYGGREGPTNFVRQMFHTQALAVIAPDHIYTNEVLLELITAAWPRAELATLRDNTDEPPDPETFREVSQRLSIPKLRETAETAPIALLYAMADFGRNQTLIPTPADRPNPGDLILPLAFASVAEWFLASYQPTPHHDDL